MNIVLLDRDGTVIAEAPDGRVNTVAKIKLFPDSIEALRNLAAHDFAVILITNQAGISEGRMSQEEFDHVHAEVLRQLAPSGIRILKTFVCPHTAKDACVCRKPQPTMLLQAAQEFGFDLSQTYMVGDRHSDVLAGVRAGTRSILLRTTHKGAEAPEATYIAATLLEAVTYIVDHP